MRKNNFEYHYVLAYYKAAENLEALSKDIRRALDMETRVQLLNMYIPLYVAWRVNFACKVCSWNRS